MTSPFDKLPTSVPGLSVPGLYGPEGGWKPETYYAVEISFTARNRSTAILYSGSLNGPNGTPGRSAYLWSASLGLTVKLSDCHYCKVLRELDLTAPK